MWAFFVPLVLGATDLGGTLPQDDHVPAFEGDGWKAWIFEPNCTLLYYSGWTSDIEIRQKDIYNYEEVMLAIRPKLRKSAKCSMMDSSLRGNFALTTTPEVPTSNNTLYKCGLDGDDFNSLCLLKFVTFAKLNFKTDAHKWKRFYLWRQLWDLRGAPVNEDLTRDPFILSNWMVFKEYQIYWDPDMSVMTSDRICAKHGDVDELHWQQNLDQQWRAEFLERTFIYPNLKDEAKGVMCVRFMDKPFPNPDVGFNWNVNPDVPGYFLSYPDAYNKVEHEEDRRRLHENVELKDQPATNGSQTFLAPQRDEVVCDSNHADCRTCTRGCCIPSTQLKQRETTARRLTQACVCDPQCTAIKTPTLHNQANGISGGSGEGQHGQKGSASTFALFAPFMLLLSMM